VSAPYVLIPEAQEHIDQNCAYIAQDSVDAALRVYDAFEEAFGLLAERPGLGHSREDLTNRLLRFWSVFRISSPDDGEINLFARHAETVSEQT
jgi:plasmid stabilization system protein ParE